MKPIYMSWDERGRAWVVEARDYPHNLVPEGQPGNDTIKICEDTDGDGKADKFTVFADKLNLATSLVFVKGGVLVSEARRMLLLLDSDGDDRADMRKTILPGWGVGDSHATQSNLTRGFDNWIYGAWVIPTSRGMPEAGIFASARVFSALMRTDQPWSSCINTTTTPGALARTPTGTSSVQQLMETPHSMVTFPLIS